MLLTRDNLAKRNWNGSKKCCFCGSEDTVNHVFISCHFARLVWRIIYATFDIPSPTNITNMFRNWLNGIDNKTKAKIRIGISVVCWLIWNCRNSIVFNRKDSSIFLQVIHMTIHWIQLWRFLSPEDQRECMVIGCNRLQATWRHVNRLQDS